MVSVTSTNVLTRPFARGMRTLTAYLNWRPLEFSFPAIVTSCQMCIAKQEKTFAQIGELTQEQQEVAIAKAAAGENIPSATHPPSFMLTTLSLISTPPVQTPMRTHPRPVS